MSPNPIDLIVVDLKEAIPMMIIMRTPISDKEDDLRRALLLEMPLMTRRLVGIDPDLGVPVEHQNTAKKTDNVSKGFDIAKIIMKFYKLVKIVLKLR